MIANSAQIILVAGGITIANEWASKEYNVRVPIATIGAAVVFHQFEKFSKAAAITVASIILAATLVGGITPGVPSPIARLQGFLNEKSSA